jgi:hypothetical protein
MKTLVPLLIATILVAGCADPRIGTPPPDAVATRGVVSYIHVPQAPPVDGKLASPVWMTCPELKLGQPMSDEIGDLKATARVVFTDTHLYVAWECLEPDTSGLKTEAVDRDDDAWNDDSVELFIAPGPDADGYHFAVNSKGVLQDWREGDLYWDSGARAAATVEANQRWVVTLAVPLKDLAPTVGAGQTWPMNLNRTKPLGFESWIETSWSAAGRADYNDRSGWGKIVGVDISAKAAE